jgi:effector-binding domain-containing protein
MKKLVLVLVASALGSSLMAIESAYPMTGAGVCEIKTLPAGVILQARSSGDYFSENNGLFRRLFQTIQQNKVPMTTPVEAGMRPGTMIFYLDPESAKRGDLQMVDGVTRKRVGERVVASIGIRGGYSKESFEKHTQQLREWLKSQPKYQAVGEAYAVYWNSPFTIWFLKRAEVHLPVQEK